MTPQNEPGRRQPAEKRFLSLTCSECGSQKQSIAYATAAGALAAKVKNGTALACPQCDWVSHFPRIRAT